LKKTVKQILSAATYPILLVAFVTAVWYIAAAIADSEFILPPPHAALKRFFVVIVSADFYASLFSSLYRALIAFLFSVLGAAVLALLSSSMPRLKRFLSPLVSILRAIPTMAIVLLLVIWTGANNAPIVVTLIVLLPTLYSAFTDAISGVDETLVEACKVCGGSKKAVALKVYLPLALPACTQSVASAVSLSIKLTVAAEVLAVTAGSLGAKMQLAQIYVETADLMALTVATVLISFLLEKLASFLFSLSLRRWSPN
jgi:NitT/TauT family transport system permease protein